MATVLLHIPCYVTTLVQIYRNFYTVSIIRAADIALVNMSNPASNAHACSCDQQDSSVSSSLEIELETYDRLLVRLLNVRKFLSSSLFPRAFSTRFNVILENLSEAGCTVPYSPPTADVIQSVDNFVKLVTSNKELFDGIVESTRSGLTDLLNSTSN